MSQGGRSLPRAIFLKVTLLAWIGMLGIDLFVHAGLLARFYLEPGGFLHPPEQAFALIPLGYASFLLQAALVVWIAARLGISSWSDGLRFGSIVGVALGGAYSLGLLSITSGPPRLLLGWGAGLAAELAAVGLIAGAGLGADRLGRLALGVALFVIALFAVTILLQSLGLAPALRANP